MGGEIVGFILGMGMVMMVTMSWDIWCNSSFVLFSFFFPFFFGFWLYYKWKWIG